MPGLPEKDILRFEQRLKQRREQLRWLVHDALIESKRDDYVKLADQVHDAGEESVAALLEGVNLAILEREVAELQDIEAALARIQDGGYGVCVDCGDAIAPERLEADPTPKRCIGCQSRHENRRGGRDATTSL